MEGNVETNSDESDITNVYPTNGTWTSTNNNQNNTNNSNSTLLFIAVSNVEYVDKGNAGGDYKFESESFSPPTSTYSEFDQHVSPLDPNMSSTARYSPVYPDSVDNGYNNSVVILPESVNTLMQSEMCQNSEYVNTNNGSYNHHLPSPTSPLDSISSPLSTSENQLLRQVVANRYLQMVNNGNGVEVDDTSCTSSGSPVVDFNQRSPDDAQIIDKELQLVQFPVNGYNGLSMERNLKIDPDQVELLITDQNTVVSYSISQDFLVNRNPLSALPEDEQQLNQVLNTLGSHSLVIETQQDGVINEVGTQEVSAMSIGEGQMMLQDPLGTLDNELLLQSKLLTPVEIALDDSDLTTNNSLTLKNNQIHNDSLQLQSEEMNQMSLQSSEMIVCNNVNNGYVKKEGMCEEDDDSFEAQQLRRSRRSRQNADDELHPLNRVQTISDKPVPSRARATLPASYLVINKLPTSGDAEPEYGVFARKVIPKRTQFGPLEGVLEENSDNNDEFKLLLETETGAMHKLNISDENTSNWMRFVRPAKNYNDLNLVLSQQGHSLYYTTTRAILPRQELQVGYSAAYASKRKLPVLQPNPEDESGWHCYECPSKFSTSEEFQKHLNVHDENKDENNKPRIKKFGRFKRRNGMDCPFCSRSFLKKFSLNRHLLSHTNPGAFRDSKQVRQVKRHNVKPEEFEKYLQWKCGICNLCFSNPSLHNIHELVHKTTNSETITGLPLDLGSNCHEGEFLIQSGAVQCPECSKEFSSHKELIHHVSEHGQKIDNEPPKDSKKGFKCILCYKAFANRDRLQRHMLVHGSEESKPLKCDVCCKRFLNNSALACHLKTHKIDKKIFECPICKSSYDQVLLLKDHVKTHCVNGTYTCPHCNKIFREYSIIRKHIRAFHCDRKHSCQHCNKNFPTLDKLRMHLLRHSDHREFLCADCGKQFKRKDKLKEHMKRMHATDRDVKFSAAPMKSAKSSGNSVKKFMPKVQPTDYHRFIYKCHTCLLGFKRRGMLVNHLAKRHPDISPDSVPELNLPILKTTRDYYCQYCDKVYKSSSKRKAHILKNHPGAELPMSNRRKGGVPEIPGVPNPTFSQTVGSVTTNPHGCQWCHKQYASKAKLLQHQRKKHPDLVPSLERKHKVPKLPPSPAIPDDSKYGNSPNVPGDLGAVDSNGIIDVTEEQLNAFETTNFIKCEDTKVVFDNSNTKSYKVHGDNQLMQQSVEEYVDCRNNGQYYRIIQMPSDHVTLNQISEESVDDPPEPCRLYRLLTSNGPFPPYPPR